MLLAIHNLPANYQLHDVRSLLLSKCGLSQLILDNLVPEGSVKKVTVGVSDDGDAAILVRKINGLYLNGQQLYVEDVRKKRFGSEQPYRSETGFLHAQHPSLFHQQIQIETPQFGCEQPYRSEQGIQHALPQMYLPPQHYIPQQTQIETPQYLEPQAFLQPSAMAMQTLYVMHNQAAVIPNFGMHDAPQDAFGYQAHNQPYQAEPALTQHSDPVLAQLSREYQNPWSQPTNQDWTPQVQREEPWPRPRSCSPRTNRQWDEHPDLELRQCRNDWSFREDDSHFDRVYGRAQSPRPDREPDEWAPRDVYRVSANYHARDDAAPVMPLREWGLQMYDPEDAFREMPSRGYDGTSLRGYGDGRDCSRFEPRPRLSDWFDRPPRKKKRQALAVQTRFRPNGFAGETRRNRAGDFKAPPYKPALKKPLPNKDETMRGQAVSKIAKIYLEKFGVYDLSNAKFIILKRWLRNRLDIMLGKTINVSVEEMVEQFMQKQKGRSFLVKCRRVVAGEGKNADQPKAVTATQLKPKATGNKDPPSVNIQPVKASATQAQATKTQPARAPATKAHPAKKPATKASATKTQAAKASAAKTQAAKALATNTQAAKNNAKVKVKVRRIMPTHPEGKKKISIGNKKVIKMEFSGQMTYALEPDEDEALESDLADIAMMIKEECGASGEHASPADRFVAEQADVVAGEVGKILRLHTTRRLKDITNHLNLRIFAHPSKVKKATLAVFLKRYGVTSLRKAVKGEAFLATVDTFQHYDVLVAMKKAHINEGQTITIEALHLIGPKPKSKPKDKKPGSGLNDGFEFGQGVDVGEDVTENAEDEGGNAKHVVENAGAEDARVEQNGEDKGFGDLDLIDPDDDDLSDF